MASKPQPAASALKRGHLLLYNLASATAWGVVLGRTLALLALGAGAPAVHAHVGAWTRWTQTAALMEVVHSLLGIVRAPLLTTTMQVASRLLLVWPVVHARPSLALSPAYTSMLLAWSAAEVVRHAYFAARLAGARPRLLTWVRYSTFYVLYPVGIASECVLVWGRAASARGAEASALYAVLAVYVPGSYVLFTHMMRQRRKAMRELGARGGGEAR